MIESIGIDTTKSALSQAELPQMVSTLREMETEARSFVDVTIRFLENVRREFQRRGKDEEFFTCALGKFGDLYGLFGEGRPFDFSKFVEWAIQYDLLEAAMSSAMESLVEKRTGAPRRPWSAAPLLGGKTAKTEWLNSWKRYRNFHRNITCKKTTSRTGHTVRHRRSVIASCSRALDTGGGSEEPDPDPEPPFPVNGRGAPEPVHISTILQRILEKLQANLTAKPRMEGAR